MLTSEFIFKDKPFEEKVPLAKSGATSLSYKVIEGGKLYFMKQLKPQLQPNQRNRVLFYKEFEIGSSISNEYVVKYERICEDETCLYILMEFVHGKTVNEELENGSYFADERNTWRFIIQLLEGLKAFHAKGLAYLDLNPNNIMLTQVGNNVKIIDLGFCFSNSYGHTVGTTAGFASPELMRREINEIDERSDIYAVGCLMKYIQERQKRVYSNNYNRIMSRCLKERKEERYCSADEMIRAIHNRNIKRNIPLALSLVALLLTGLFLLFPRDGKETKIDTVSINGVNYRILSTKDSTCEVTGGEGDKGNLYINGTVKIGGHDYKTEQIAQKAFMHKPLLSVYFPEGLKTISAEAFYNCDSIVSIYIPSTVDNIQEAFVGMESLVSIRIPPEMETIQRCAFAGCISLENIEIPEGVKRICLDAFAGCTSLKHVSLPSTLQFLERGIFYECSSLEEITIPASVEEIGDYVFYECNSLKHVYNYATIPQKINMIINTKGVCVHVPAEALNEYRQDFNWGKYNLIGDL